MAWPAQMKIMVWLFGAALGFYIPFTIMYTLTVTKTGNVVIPDKGQDSFTDFKVPFMIKDVMPNADGNIDLKMTVNFKELMRLLDNTGASDATSNPLPHDFDIVLHDKNLCNDTNLQWIVYIHSAPKNVNRRKIVRSTWGDRNLFKDRRIRLVFLMGVPSDKEEQKIINEEFSKYKDIVQGSFMEHYRNLTYKGIMGLKWVSTYCKNAKYALKTDDDAFIHIFKLMNLVNEKVDNINSITCPLWKDHTMPILRDPAKCMKWCVKYNEFPGKTHFPKYCAGIGFVMSRNLVVEMYKVSKTTPFFWIDDVYITGLLPKPVNPTPQYIDLLQNFTLKQDIAIEEYVKNKKTDKIFVHVKTEEKFYTLWNATLAGLNDKDIQLLSSDIIKTLPEIRTRINQLT